MRSQPFFLQRKRPVAWALRGAVLLVVVAASALANAGTIVVGPEDLDFGPDPVFNEGILSFTNGSVVSQVVGTDSSAPEIISYAHAERGPTFEYNLQAQVFTKGGFNSPLPEGELTSISLQGESDARGTVTPILSLGGGILYSFVVLSADGAAPAGEVPLILRAKGFADVFAEGFDPESGAVSFSYFARVIVDVAGPVAIDAESPFFQSGFDFTEVVDIFTQGNGPGSAAAHDYDDFEIAQAFNASVGARYDVGLSAQSFVATDGNTSSAFARAGLDVFLDPEIYIDPSFPGNENYFVLFNTPHITGPAYTVAPEQTSFVLWGMGILLIIGQRCRHWRRVL